MKPSRHRLDPDVRKAQILDATLELSRTHGYTRVTKQMIADKLGTSTGIVNCHYGTVNQLRRDIIRHAIKIEDVTIIGQALVERDPNARKVPPDLRAKVIAAVAAAL